MKNGGLITTSLDGEEELCFLRLELARFSNSLAEREMEMAEVRLRLSRFQSRYYARVAPKYMALDQLRARLAELHAQQAPLDDGLLRAARQARINADRTAREFRDYDSEGVGDDEPPPVTAELKQVYRQIAAKIHPDRAEDREAEELRTRLMAELNDAFSKGDLHRMKEILASWESSPEAIVGQSPEAVSRRLSRTLKRLKLKLRYLESEMTQLKRQELYRLMVRVQEAEAQGRDLLQELIDELDREIARATAELSAQKEYRHVKD